MKIHFQEGDYYIIKDANQLVATLGNTIINYSIENCILNLRRSWENRWERALPQILHDDNGFTWTFSTPNDRNLYLTIEKDGEYYSNVNDDKYNNKGLGSYNANQFYFLSFDRYDGDYAILYIHYGVPYDYFNRGSINYAVQYYDGYNGAINETYERGVSNLLLPRYNFGLVNNIVPGIPFTNATGIWKARTDLAQPWDIGGNSLLMMSSYNKGTIKVPKELIILDSTDPYFEGGNTDVSEMTGDFDDSSDPIDFPSLPSLGATDTGLITLYNPSLAEVKALATYMWTNPAFDISAWKKIFADPIDAILGLSIVPVAVPDGGQRHIAVGNLFTDVVMNVAAQQYIELQCGALNVNEFWSSYLDYEPYTKAEIYLPYCGVHQLSVDDIMDKTVEVRYHIDILTGSCCAYVKCGDSVLYQFIGQCSSSIPVASGDFSEIIGSALNAALAVGSLAATGGASAPFSVPEITANAVNILKEKIQKSGSLSGTGGMLAIQKPYLILTRPRQAVPANQNHYTGYPSFITENLSELSGYTEIEDIHLENVSATDSELNEIVTLLEGGVIF